jgi:MFS family permease
VVVTATPAPAVVPLRRNWRRMVLIGAETARMLAATSIAVTAALDRLTMPHLLVVAAALGAGAACAAPARMLVVRSLIPPQQLTAALTQEEVRQGTAALAGPPLGGVLFAARQALPFVFSAAAFAASLLCALIVRRRPAPRRRNPADPAQAHSPASEPCWAIRCCARPPC